MGDGERFAVFSQASLELRAARMATRGAARQRLEPPSANWLNNQLAPRPIFRARSFFSHSHLAYQCVFTTPCTT